MSAALTVAATVGAGLLALLAVARWLRVAQREHYVPWRTTPTALAWLRAWPLSYLPWALALALFAVPTGSPALRLGQALLAAFSPVTLRLVRATKKLAWTRRMIRLAAVAAVLVVGLWAAAGTAGLVVAALLAPVVVDLALAVTRPWERRSHRRFAAAASERLRRADPTVVAITGSYGKTSTKNFAAHLCGEVFSAYATPGSWNNLMGLSRAVTERMPAGTDVFLAEMGTYGPGEIKEMCSYFPPDVAAIITIGEAHLERMGSREGILAAKSEILDGARTWVLNVDDDLLRPLADDPPPGVRVVRCGTDPARDPDVLVEPRGEDGVCLVVPAHDVKVELPVTARPDNVAIAVGIALAVATPVQSIVSRLSSLPAVTHRAEVARDPRGFAVIDDTYNSNPQGATSALATAVGLVAEGGRLYVVTPGMFELGDQQVARNTEWARAVVGCGRPATLMVVGRSNRAALLAGAAGGDVETFPTRAAAMAAVHARATAADVILFENDLPDHLP